MDNLTQLRDKFDAAENAARIAKADNNRHEKKRYMLIVSVPDWVEKAWVEKLKSKYLLYKVNIDSWQELSEEDVVTVG